jgi:alpha-beta hydrolase superfamily lysophospholipase
MTPFRAVYLDARGEPFLALLHDAAGEGPAVLFVPPLGWEDITSYRSRLEWAESLAEGGMPTLRFDLPGTGDSAGGPGDAGRLESWIEAVGVAGRFLRSETRRPRVVALGVGLGGLLALAAAADGAPIDDFVLWGVPARGKTFVRELTAFAGIEAGLIVAGGSPEPPPLPSGAIAPGGFVLPGATLRALEQLDVADLDLPAPETRRALLLDRDGIPAARALVQKLRDSGVQVDLADGHGYGEMLTRTPEATRLPHGVRDRVRDWLEAEAPHAVPTRPPVPPPAAPPVSIETELSVGDARIRERPFPVDHDGGRLFGILAEPVDAPPQELALVLLNAGAVRRVGPSRLWVELARRWAARGVPTLRLDLRAIGDASGDADRYVDVAGLYAEEYVGQVRAALDRLAEGDVARRFALFGLCSGAYWAFHTALVDDRVSLAVMLNSRLLFWEHGQTVNAERRARELRKSVFRMGAWRRALWGDRRLGVRGLLAFARLVATDPIRRRARARAHDESRVATEKAFDRLAGGAARARGVFLFTDGEPLLDELEAAGMVVRPDRWPSLEFVKLPGRDHILRPLWMHEQLREEVDRALAAELQRLSGPTPVVPPVL